MVMVVMVVVVAAAVAGAEVAVMMVLNNRIFGLFHFLVEQEPSISFSRPYMDFSVQYLYSWV